MLVNIKAKLRSYNVILQNLQSHDVQQKLQALGRQVAAAQAQRIKDNAQSQKSAKQSVLVSFFMKL